jgi:uncharacterized membrane protein
MTELSSPPQAPSAQDLPANSALDGNPEQFSAVLTPHRSLGPKGFVVLMTAVSAVSFSTGLLFYLIGAWPVIGFMGLDVALLYAAFKLNFRALRLYEMVDLTPEALTVTRVLPSGRKQAWSFNPYWVRLAVDERVGRSTEMSLASHGNRLVFGGFLTDPEREDFAAALSRALRVAKNPSLA